MQMKRFHCVILDVCVCQLAYKTIEQNCLWSLNFQNYSNCRRCVTSNLQFNQNVAKRQAVNREYSAVVGGRQRVENMDGKVIYPSKLQHKMDTYHLIGTGMRNGNKFSIWCLNSFPCISSHVGRVAQCAQCALHTSLLRGDACEGTELCAYLCCVSWIHHYADSKKW